MMEATNSLKSVILETQVNGGQPVFDDPPLCNTYKYRDYCDKNDCSDCTTVTTVTVLMYCCVQPKSVASPE